MTNASAQALPMLEVLDGGFATSFQDAGRIGFRQIGVTVSGALDRCLLGCANGLLGNPPTMAALEMRGFGPKLRVRTAPVRVSLAGVVPAKIVRADGSEEKLSPWRSVCLHVDDMLHVGGVQGTAYLAVAGGWALPQTLASLSTYSRARLGGMQGRNLQAGDCLPCAVAALPSLPDRQQRRAWTVAETPGAGRPAASPIRLRVMAGPQADYFSEQTQQSFAQTVFAVTREADRMGMRLQGEPLQHAPDKGAEIISDGITPGAIQVPADGRPIVLLADCQTVGGYPKIATVISADLPLLAHVAAGAQLVFEYVDRQQAQAALQAQEKALQAWLAGIDDLPVKGASLGEDFYDLAALWSNNLVSGMVNAWQPAYEESAGDT